MTRPWFVFSGDDYDRGGGMNDFRGQFATLEQAEAAARLPMPPDGCLPDWWHVVNVCTGESLSSHGGPSEPYLTAIQ